MQSMRHLRREPRSRGCCRGVAESLRILLPKLLPPSLSGNRSWSQSGTAGIHGGSWNAISCRGQTTLKWGRSKVVISVALKPTGSLKPRVRTAEQLSNVVDDVP